MEGKRIMIKKAVFIFLFTLIIPASSAWAVGIGAYGTGGVAFNTWYYQGSSYGSTTDYLYGGGLIIDSNAAQDSLFNYRFTGGYEQYVITDPKSGETGDPIHRFSMTHTFGFGVARSDVVRFWLGPRLGFHYLYKRDSYMTYEFYPGVGTFTIIPVKNEIKLDGIGLDVMLALGVNFNIGQVVTLFIDIGFGYAGLVNINDTKDAGHSFGLDGKVGIMFRVNDTYSNAM